MTWKLFLDDIRFPVDDTFEIARDADEAEVMIYVKGYPSEMTLDHDLGENIPTGHDFLKRQIELSIINGTKRELAAVNMYVHSANPVGKANMIGLWKSFQQFAELPDED